MADPGHPRGHYLAYLPYRPPSGRVAAFESWLAKNNPSESLRLAREGPVVVLNRDSPEGILISLHDRTLHSDEDVRAVLAIALYRDRALPLARAARVAGVPLERFMEQVSAQGIPVLIGSAESVDSDLQTVTRWKKKHRSSSTPGR